MAKSAAFVSLVLVSVALMMGSLESLDMGKKKAILKRFGQCKGASTLPILFNGIVIAPDKTNHEMQLSFKVTVKREISNKFAIAISFWKCDASGNPDSCEYVLKDYNATNICRIMGAKNEIWSDFMDHFNMPRRCPIKPGVYVMSRTPITTDFMKFMPISDALWKIKLTGWDAGKYVACVELEEQVIAYYGNRKH